MNPPEPSVATVRATFLIANFCFLFGIFGVVSGVQTLTAGGRLDPVPVAFQSDPRLAAASEQFQAAFTEAQRKTPGRGVLQAANALVSALLIVGGWTLLTRRATAPWWLTQASIANGVWTLADGAAQIAGFWAAREALGAAIVEVANASEPAPNAPAVTPDGAALVQPLNLLWVILTLVRVLPYLWVWRRATRDDIARLLRPA